MIDGADVADSESSSFAFGSVTVFRVGGLPRRLGADDESTDADAVEDEAVGAGTDTTSINSSVGAAKDWSINYSTKFESIDELRT